MIILSSIFRTETTNDLSYYHMLTHSLFTKIISWFHSRIKHTGIPVSKTILDICQGFLQFLEFRVFSHDILQFLLENGFIFSPFFNRMISIQEISQLFETRMNIFRQSFSIFRRINEMIEFT